MHSKWIELLLNILITRLIPKFLHLKINFFLLKRGIFLKVIVLYLRILGLGKVRGGKGTLDQQRALYCNLYRTVSATTELGENEESYITINIKKR